MNIATSFFPSWTGLALSGSENMQWISPFRVIWAVVSGWHAHASGGPWCNCRRWCLGIDTMTHSSRLGLVWWPRVNGVFLINSEGVPGSLLRRWICFCRRSCVVGIGSSASAQRKSRCFGGDFFPMRVLSHLWQWIGGNLVNWKDWKCSLCVFGLFSLCICILMKYHRQNWTWLNKHSKRC